MQVDARVPDAVEAFRLPETLGFGQVMAPVMYRADFADGRWGEGRLLPYGEIGIEPGAKVLNYGQAVFEGLKAYRVEHPGVRLFRPRVNAERLNRSAQRMLMPAVPEDLFLEGLCAVAAGSARFVPRESGRSLYLRPLLFGTQSTLDLAPSERCTLLVIASPSEAVASGSLRVLIERDGTRAVRGGTGAVKAGGNYGAAMQASQRVLAEGFDQPLWLDAAEHRYVEELSIMNFFAVVDGELHTPALSGTFLPGVTRDSLIMLAADLGFAVRETRLDIDWLLEMIRRGRCSEAFACGTAAIVAPIGAVGEKDGSIDELPEPSGPVARRLRTELLNIQEGRARDRFAWLYPVPESYYAYAAAG